MGKNKRSKNYYVQLAKRHKKQHNVLSPGLTGFLCTCNDRERDCVIEAYNILNEYADQLYGKEEIQVAGSCFTKDEDITSQEEIKSSETESETEKQLSSERKEDVLSEEYAHIKVVDEERSSETTQEVTKEAVNSKQKQPDKEDESKISTYPQKEKKAEDSGDTDEESLSFDAALKADVAQLQKENEKMHRHLRRFSQVATGAKNYVFIRTTLEDPLPLSLTIMDDILQQQQKKTKKLIRMIPVQATCRAFQDDIVKAVKKQCESYFKEKGESFYIAIKVRNNNSVQQESLKSSLITVVSEAFSGNTPELKDPEVVLNIDVIKNICCISFLPGYFTKYCKYNLLSLGTKSIKDEIPIKKISGAEKL